MEILKNKQINKWACCGSWGRKELDMTERLNWTEIDFKVFCTAKKSINKAKRQRTKWKKMFANYATDKGFISKIYKQLLQFNIGTCLDSHLPQRAAHVPIHTASCEEVRVQKSVNRDRASVQSCQDSISQCNGTAASDVASCSMAHLSIPQPFLPLKTAFSKYARV